MDFGLSEEQNAIFEIALDFAKTDLAPHATDWDETSTFPVEVMRNAAALGMGGLYVCEEAGGTNLSRLDGTLIFEALSHGCPTIAAYMSIHNMCAWMVDRFGSESVRAAWLTKLCSMEALASYCLTEPGVGSDAAALTTRATGDNENYTLNGAKVFISGAGVSDLYIVMARTGPDGAAGITSIVVPKGAGGMSFGALEKKMGWNAQPTATIQFDDVVVPWANRLGEEGDGFKIAMQGLDGGRLNIAACSLGAAQAALDKTIAYMGERKAFGKNLSDFQALQFRVADMETELQAARTFLRHAAWKLDQGAPDAIKFCAMAKRFVTDIGFKVANDALQIHGGYGYLQDFGIEKIVRDLRVHQILEGTNEIMRVIIARAVLKDGAA